MSKTKILFPFEILRKVVLELKKDGKRICFTHGAFDLFHYAHLDLLKKSAAICDFLVVGVESDDRVADYKYYKRPIINQEQRMNIVNSIHCVDAAFIKDIPLNIPSHVALYKELMIDIVSIGQHFDYEEIVEEQTYKSGAKLVKIPTPQDITTTGITESILIKYRQNEYQDVPKSDF